MTLFQVGSQFTELSGDEIGDCSLTNTTLKLSTKITYLSSARMPRRHQNSFLTSALVVPHRNVKCDILGLEKITGYPLTKIVIDGH